MALVPVKPTAEAVERPQPSAIEEESVGALLTRLAHETRELADIEVRRLRLEVRRQSRWISLVARAGSLAIELAVLASLALSVGVFLALGSWWHSYIGAAFVTSGLLALAALAAYLAARRFYRRMTREAQRSAPAAEDRRDWPGA